MKRIAEGALAALGTAWAGVACAISRPAPGAAAPATPAPHAGVSFGYWLAGILAVALAVVLLRRARGGKS